MLSLLTIVKSVGIFVASLLVVALVITLTNQQRATGLGYLRAQWGMFFVLGLLYLALGVFLRQSPLLK